MSVGERLRDMRQSEQLSLTEVAGKAGISAATLSRIETGKQGIDLGLFLTLVRVLKARAYELLGDGEDKEEEVPLARKIAALRETDRTQLWRDLTVARRERRRRPRADLGAQFEELLAHFDYIRQEIETVRSNMRRR